MKNCFEKALIQIKTESYLSLLIVIAPMMNFLVGINVDLYAPSLPAISHYYGIDIALAKNTITITLIGFALGALLFGTLLDIFGRRRVILFALLVYILASFAAVGCQNIEQLMIIRFIQGMMAAAISIGPRAILVDSFSGQRLMIALMYTSVSYSLGPIIAPFIGGILQVHFGWKANFLCYGFFALIWMIVFGLYVNESFHQRQAFSLKKTASNYLSVLKHKSFIAGTFIAGGTQIVQILYPTVGPFLVENQLHQTAVVYGNSALMVGLGYLLGTLCNRVLIKRLSVLQLLNLGFALLIMAVCLQVLLGFVSSLNIWTLLLPFLLIEFGTGFLFANILGHCLKLFPKNAGIAGAVFICVLMVITAGGLFIISLFNVHNLLNLAGILATIILLAAIIFYRVLRPEMKKVLL